MWCLKIGPLHWMLSIPRNNSLHCFALLPSSSGWFLSGTASDFALFVYQIENLSSKNSGVWPVPGIKVHILNGFQTDLFRAGSNTSQQTLVEWWCLSKLYSNEMLFLFWPCNELTVISDILSRDILHTYSNWVLQSPFLHHVTICTVSFSTVPLLV